jgi:hypothetical protein
MLSAFMTLASMPFLWAYFLGGGGVKTMRVLPQFAVFVVRFFHAYLNRVSGVLYATSFDSNVISGI